MKFQPYGNLLNYKQILAVSHDILPHLYEKMSHNVAVSNMNTPFTHK